MPTRFERLFELLDSHETSLRVSASDALAATLRKANSNKNKDRIKACLCRAYEALTSKSARRRGTHTAHSTHLLNTNNPKTTPTQTDASSRLLGKAASTVQTVTSSSCVPPTTLKMSALKHFGVNKLIKKGARLFGSSGEEYDVKSSASWEKQRDALLREISIASKDDDVPVLPSNRRIDRELHSDLVPSTSTSVVPVVNSSDDRGESAPRLLLATSKKTSTQESRSDCDGFIKTWPLLMTRLSSDLLSPTWHVRHGAAIGLASVIPHLGNLTSSFLEDCAVRCLCLLALDRFKDFYLGTCCVCSRFSLYSTTFSNELTGTARAPCAEAAARLISSLKKNPSLTYELFADVRDIRARSARFLIVPLSSSHTSLHENYSNIRVLLHLE